MATEILIIDDNSDIRNILDELIQDAGYKTRLAANFNQGLLEIDKKLPDVAIIDVKLDKGDTDGIELLNHIKTKNNDIPCKTDIIFKNNSAYLLASAKKSMNATFNFAKLMDLEVIVISDQSQGHATQVAKEHASFIKSYIEKIKFKKSKKIFCFISGGETSVKVINKNGKGGRNTEYLLSLAIELELLRVKSFVAIAADTDGIDGLSLIHI